CLRGFLLLWLSPHQSDLLNPGGIAWTPGCDIGVILEGIVDNAPLIGIHRLELKRSAGNADTLGQFADTLDDTVFAHGTIMFAIDDNLFSVLVFCLKQTIEQKLNGFERFTIAADQAPALFRVDLEGEITALILHL